MDFLNAITQELILHNIPEILAVSVVDLEQQLGGRIFELDTLYPPLMSGRRLHLVSII